MTVKFNTYSMLTAKKYDDDWYEWCVFVDEKADVIAQIKSVEYTLHPSFPDPVRLIEDKASKFALLSSGWGAFSIKIRISYEDGSSSTSSYFLRLEDNSWPHPAPKDFGDSDTKSVYESLLHEKYRWRKLQTLVKNSNLSETKVLNILHELESKDLVRKASFLSIDGKEMWGATAVVGVLPKMEGRSVTPVLREDRRPV